MKYLLLLIGLLVGMVTMGQAPQKMSYQMVVRNSSNVLVANQTVGVRISLLQGSATGTAVFVETHAPATNGNGLASLVIGNGTAVTGSFAAVDWANGPFFIKTETDPTGGTSYSITATSQLMSVPYALYAGSTTNLGKSHLIISDEITDAEAAERIVAEAGPNTQFLWIQNTSNLTTLNLQGLTNLIEVVIDGNIKLATVNLPDLKRVTRAVQVTNNPKLSSINYASLRYANDISIKQNDSLSSVFFPMLSRARTMAIEINQSLINFSIPLLDTVNRISFSMNKLPTVSAPTLSTVYSVIGVSNPGINITNNGNNLTSISFPNLKNVSGKFLISNNPALTSLTIPTLINIKELNIQINAALGAVAAASMINAETIYIYNNSSLATISFPQLTTNAVSFVSSFDNALTSVSLPQLTSIGNFEAANNSSLASINLPLLTTMGAFNVYSNPALTSVSLPQYVTGNGNISLSGAPLLPSISFPQLVSITGNINISAIAAISFPLLITVNGKIELIGSSIQPPSVSFPELVTITNDLSLNSKYSSLSFPKLSTIRSLTIENPSNTSLMPFVFPKLAVANNISFKTAQASSLSMPMLLKAGIVVISGSSLTNLSLPVLDSTYGLVVYETQLSTISLPVLKVAQGPFEIRNNSVLTSMSFPMLNQLGQSNSIYSDINLNVNMLNSSGVNNVLNKLVSITPPLQNKIIKLNQYTTATPTGQGLIDLATLQARPNTVYTY